MKQKTCKIFFGISIFLSIIGAVMFSIAFFSSGKAALDHLFRAGILFTMGGIIFSVNEIKSSKVLAVMGVAIALLGLVSLYISTTADLVVEGEQIIGGQALISDASECREKMKKKGQSIGEPNETLCQEICSSWKSTDMQLKFTQEAKQKGITSPYQVCISGKPSWVF